MSEALDDLLVQGISLMRSGQLELAAARFEAVLAQAPSHPSALHGLGQIAAHGGDLPQACALYQRAIDGALSAKMPLSEPIWEAAISIFERAADWRGALLLTEAFARAHPRSPLPFLHQARLYDGLGMLEACSMSWQQALSRAEHDVSVWRGWIMSLLVRRLDAQALHAWERASARLGQAEASLWLTRAQLEQVSLEHADLDAAAKRSAQALEFVDRALALNPSLGEAWLTRAQLMAARGDASALDAMAQAERHLGRSSKLLQEHAAILLALERPEQAQALCLAWLEEEPWSSGALALLSVAWARLGDARGAALAQAEQLISVDALDEVPWSTLALELEAHPMLSLAPRRHATLDGLHSGDLMLAMTPTLERLMPTLSRAISEHVLAHVQRWPSEIIKRPRPARFMMHLWSVQLRAPGHQTPHIHPDAWLSGVLYVSVPDFAPGQGALVFGQPERALGPCSTPLPAHHHAPKTGQLITFPSHLYHHTTPFDSEALRSSLAFDLIPVW